MCNVCQVSTPPKKYQLKLSLPVKLPFLGVWKVIKNLVKKKLVGKIGATFKKFKYEIFYKHFDHEKTVHVGLYFEDSKLLT